MKKVYLTHGDAIAPLGNSLSEMFSAMKMNQTGISQNSSGTYSAEFSEAKQKQIFGGVFSPDFPGASAMLNRLLVRFLAHHSVLSQQDSLLVICSTKGDIEALNETETPLLHMVQRLRRQFRVYNEPVILSHACISGLHGLIYAQRLIANGEYKRVVVAAVDTVSDFVLSGFQSLMALSAQPCTPFDASRSGVTLGEAVAIALLQDIPEGKSSVEVLRGSVTNDANHITGPSRDGAGLYLAIRNTLDKNEAGLSPENSFISPHGTATNYNDEMESKAFQKAGLIDLPAIAYKGYFGHTLGAAGLLESLLGMETLRTGLLPASHGYSSSGVTYPFNLSTGSQGPRQLKRLKYFLKTGSGFGGCNAALLFKSQV